jgi:hypothetical protein
MAEPIPVVTTWRDYISTIIAVIALVQPWCLWLWRKVFRSGRIDIYKTGTIEVGYSDLGPTIGLQGTLHGRDKELFVQAISLEIIREADNARHGFEWAAFRNVRMVSSRPNEIELAIPAGFLLLPSQPFRYNIVSTDGAFAQQHVQPALERLRAAWVAAVQLAHGNAPWSTNPQDAQKEMQHAGQAAYPAFENQDAHVTAFAELAQQCYWNPGWYKLTMRIETVHPITTFTRQWRFQLTETQSKALRTNAIKVVKKKCDQSTWDYDFAYLPYQDVA